MTAPDTTAAEARQLLRLRELREDTARQALDRARHAHDAAQGAVQRREQQLVQVRRTRSALLGWLCGAGASELPRVAPAAGARLGALDEEIERAELALSDERIALAEAARALALAQGAWVHARGRRQAVALLADDARRAQQQQREQRAERELDDTRAQPQHG
jgi:flagellar biosynthesis chaperone FliJ